MLPNGYSLWMVPRRSSEAYKLLSHLISQVAMEYLTPIFIPHVTLLGNIDRSGRPEQYACEKARLLADELSPFEIKLDGIGSNDTYFQILFFSVKQTPAVINANAVAQKVFAVSRGKYFPHLSIAYGDLYNHTDALKRLASQHPANELCFLTHGVDLWRTEGPVREWYRIATFPFKTR